MNYCNYRDVTSVYSLNSQVARPFLVRPGNEASTYMSDFDKVYLRLDIESLLAVSQ